MRGSVISEGNLKQRGNVPAIRETMSVDDVLQRGTLCRALVLNDFAPQSLPCAEINFAGGLWKRKQSNASPHNLPGKVFCVGNGLD